MSLLNVKVDPDNVLARQFSELERKQLPFATMRAINEAAFQIRERWAVVMPRVFDKPTALTLKAVLYKKASLQKPQAQVFIRDEASNGTPPAKYLQAQVEGGTRRHKGIEKTLSNRGVLASNMFVVPGKGAQLDAHGNISRGQIQAIKSQLGVQSDKYANETDVSRTRRLKRESKKGARNSSYFAVKTQRGNLQPGVYQRTVSGFGAGLRSILFFVRSVRYRKRYQIFDLAQKFYDRNFPRIFDKELAKALADSFSKAFK